jgi:secreted protein with Ig-like and vWFA domain
MKKISETQTGRGIRLLTFVNKAEYQLIQERYHASSAPSLRAYQRHCLVGRSLKLSKEMSAVESYTILGELTQTLRQVLDALEEINEEVEFEDSEVTVLLTELRLSLKPLRQEISELRQQLISLSS